MTDRRKILWFLLSRCKSRTLCLLFRTRDLAGKPSVVVSDFGFYFGGNTQNTQIVMGFTEKFIAWSQRYQYLSKIMFPMDSKYRCFRWQSLWKRWHVDWAGVQKMNKQMNVNIIFWEQQNCWVEKFSWWNGRLNENTSWNVTDADNNHYLKLENVVPG